MNAAEITQIVSMLSANGDSFIQGHSPISAESLGEYYVASRTCLNRWMKLLQLVSDDAAETAFQLERDPFWAPLQQNLPVLRTLAEQVLLMGVLTRCWTTLLLARDCFRKAQDLEDLARNVYRGHDCVRKLTLNAVEDSEHLHMSHVLRIEMLRKDSEYCMFDFCGDFMARYCIWDTVGEGNIEHLYRRVDIARGEGGWDALMHDALQRMQVYSSEDCPGGVLLDDDCAEMAATIVRCFWSGGGELSATGCMVTVSA